jgi:hypothetical protein
LSGHGQIQATCIGGCWRAEDEGEQGEEAHGGGDDKAVDAGHALGGADVDRAQRP